MQKVKKRNGKIVDYDDHKILEAVRKANRDSKDAKMTIPELYDIVRRVELKLDTITVPNVERVQDAVEDVLMNNNCQATAKAYIIYRAEHAKARDAQTGLMDKFMDLTFKPADEMESRRDNANINTDTPMGTMLKYGTESSNYFNDNFIIPKKFVDAHRAGRIHIHDKDFQNLTFNCTKGSTIVTLRCNDREFETPISFFDYLFFGDAEQVFNMPTGEYQIKSTNGTFVDLRRVSRKKPTDQMYSLTTSTGVTFGFCEKHVFPVIRDDQQVDVELKDVNIGDRLVSVDNQGEVTLMAKVAEDYSDFVYDVETGDHYFSANGVLVHNCLQIDLPKLLKGGFSTGHGFIREPQSIRSYASLACIAIQSSQNDMFGGQSICTFDYAMAEGVRKSFAKEFLTTAESFVDVGEVKNGDQLITALRSGEHALPTYGVEDNVQTLTKTFTELCGHKVGKFFKSVYRATCKRVKKETYQAMESVIHNLNSMHCLPYGEKIWVFDVVENELKLMEIGKLDEVFEKNRFKAISLNHKTGQAEFKFITASQRKDNHRRLITLINGLHAKVTVTDNHKVMYLDNLGRVTEGDPEQVPHVLIPQEVNFPQVNNDIELDGLSDGRNEYAASHVHVNVSLAYVAGRYFASGEVNGNVVSFAGGTADDHDQLVNAVESVFGDRLTASEYALGKRSSFSGDQAVVKLFTDKFGTTEKRIPTQLLFAEDEVRRTFANTYGEFAVGDELLKNRELNSQFMLMSFSLRGKPELEDKPVYSYDFLGDMLGRRGEVTQDLILMKAVNDSRFEAASNVLPADIVKRVESNSGEEYVYDISVEDNETFLTGECFFVHNSRAGAQVPFSSINFGTDTSPEGRLVMEQFMLSEEKGLGNGETPIFPKMLGAHKVTVNNDVIAVKNLVNLQMQGVYLRIC